MKMVRICLQPWPCLVWRSGQILLDKADLHMEIAHEHYGLLTLCRYKAGCNSLLLLIIADHHQLPLPVLTSSHSLGSPTTLTSKPQSNKMHSKVALLLPVLAAALPQSGNAPSTDLITIGQTSYSGNGCPQGSVSTSTSADKTVRNHPQIRLEYLPQTIQSLVMDSVHHSTRLHA
jgi:hypothetical protein